MNSLFDLTGEVAVVIGGTGVLGGALAEGLAAAGAGRSWSIHPWVASMQSPN